MSLFNFRIYQELQRTSKKLDKSLGRFLVSSNLHPSEFQLAIVLNEINRDDGLTPDDLLPKVNLTSGAFTALLKRMTQKHLVEITSHPTDGRKKLIKLSLRGKSLVNSLTDEFSKLEDEFYGGLNELEKLQLIKILEQL